jgi:hypothetical protein
MNLQRSKKASPAKKSRSTFTIETWFIPTIAVSVILLMLYLLFFRGHHNDGSANWWVMSIIAVILLAAIIRSQYKGSFNLPSFKGKGFSGLGSFFSSFWSWFAKAGWKLAALVLLALWLWPRAKSDDYGSRIHHQTAGVVTYGRYFFEKGKSYSFLVNGKIPWFTQEPRNTTVFRIQKEGDAQISWTVSVTTDGFHLIEPVYMPATAYDHNYHGSDTWFTVTASESEWVNVTPELVPYGQ